MTPEPVPPTTQSLTYHLTTTFITPSASPTARSTNFITSEPVPSPDYTQTASSGKPTPTNHRLPVKGDATPATILIGPILGGIAGAILIAFIIYIVLKKRRQFREGIRAQLQDDLAGTDAQLSGSLLKGIQDRIFAKFGRKSCSQSHLACTELHRLS